MCPSGAVLPVFSAGCACVWTQRREKSERERKLVVPYISKTLQVLTPSRRISRERSSVSARQGEELGQCSAGRGARSVLGREGSSVSALDGTPLPGNKPPHNLVAKNNKHVSRLWLSWVVPIRAWPGPSWLGSVTCPQSTGRSAGD